jgi:hypothetical protein
MKAGLLLLLFFFSSCSINHYLLNSKPEHFFIFSKDETAPIANSKGVTLTYDRTPYAVVDTPNSKGGVRLRYKVIVNNFSKKPIKIAKRGITLVSMEEKQKVLGKYYEKDKKKRYAPIKRGGSLILDTIFDINEDMLDAHDGDSDPLWLNVKLTDGNKVKMKVWLWSI